MSDLKFSFVFERPAPGQRFGRVVFYHHGVAVAFPVRSDKPDLKEQEAQIRAGIDSIKLRLIQEILSAEVEL